MNTENIQHLTADFSVFKRKYDSVERKMEFLVDTCEMLSKQNAELMKQNRLLIQFHVKQTVKQTVTISESPAIGVAISSNNDTNDISAPILGVVIHPKRQKQALIHNYGNFGLTNNNEVPKSSQLHELPCSSQKGVTLVKAFVYWYKSFDA